MVIPSRITPLIFTLGILVGCGADDEPKVETAGSAQTTLAAKESKTKKEKDEIDGAGQGRSGKAKGRDKVKARGDGQQEGGDGEGQGGRCEDKGDGTNDSGLNRRGRSLTHDFAFVAEGEHDTE